MRELFATEYWTDGRIDHGETLVVLILNINVKKRKEIEHKYRDLVENANSIILKLGS